MDVEFTAAELVSKTFLGLMQNALLKWCQTFRPLNNIKPFKMYFVLLLIM